MKQGSLDYDAFGRQLAVAEVESGAAEVHGLLCGLLCGGAADARGQWLQELLSDQSAEGNLLVAECQSAMDEMYRLTDESIAGMGMRFSAFLPDDSQSVSERGAAVVDWCQGFLYGMGLSAGSENNALSEDASEALSTLSEISRMDLDSLQQNEEDAASLEEIIEFIWVAALLVHSDLASGSGDSQ